MTAGQPARAAALPRRPPARLARGGRRLRWARIVSHGVLLGLGLLAVFPVLWAVLTSLRPETHIYDLTPLTAPTLANYASGLRSYPFIRLLLNTVVIAGSVTVLQIAFALPAAYALTRFRFRGRGLVLALLVGSLLVPAQITLIPDYVIVARLGLLNTLFGVVLPEVGTVGFAVVVLRSSLLDFPTELYEAAMIDGAGPFATLWRVVVPNLRPAIASAAVLVLVSSWNEYFWPLLVTNQLSSMTLQLGLQTFQSERGTDWGALLAMNSLAMLPVALLFLLAQRRITDAFVRSGIR